MSNESEVNNQVLNAKLDFALKGMDEIKKDLKQMQGEFVRNAEFEPIKRVVYSMVGLIMVSVVGALLTLILK